MTEARPTEAEWRRLDDGCYLIRFKFGNGEESLLGPKHPEHLELALKVSLQLHKAFQAPRRRTIRDERPCDRQRRQASERALREATAEFERLWSEASPCDPVVDVSLLSP